MSLVAVSLAQAQHCVLVVMESLDRKVAAAVVHTLQRQGTVQ